MLFHRHGVVWANTFEIQWGESSRCRGPTMNYMWVVLDHVGFSTGFKGNELLSCNFWAPQLVSATAQALCLVFLGLVNLSVSCIF